MISSTDQGGRGERDVKAIIDLEMDFGGLFQRNTSSSGFGTGRKGGSSRKKRVTCFNIRVRTPSCRDGRPIKKILTQRTREGRRTKKEKGGENCPAVRCAQNFLRLARWDESMEKRGGGRLLHGVRRKERRRMKECTIARRGREGLRRVSRLLGEKASLILISLGFRGVVGREKGSETNKMMGGNSPVSKGRRTVWGPKECQFFCCG